MNAGGFRVASSINHERLDDEVIAINLHTGTYYALDDVAADCWSIAVAGGGVDAMVGAVAARYGVPEATVEPDVRTFMSQLVAAGLVVEGGPAGAVTLDVDTVPNPYTAPVLAVYDDLETLLLIDPIHEVDEAGWPMQPSAPDEE